MFSKNVGNLDRLLRVALGIGLLVAFFALPESGFRWFFLIGLIPLATGLASTCPIYSVLGVSTCPRKG